MKKLIWIIGFTRYMHWMTNKGMTHRLCFEYALSTLENIGDDWKEFTPKECADEEMSCWSD